MLQSIFISSSGDLSELRKNLRNDLYAWLDQHGFSHLLKAYLWEEDKEDGRLLSDRQRIQSQLPDPADPDVPLTICLFGERCGSPLEDDLDPLVSRRFDRWRAEGDRPGLLHPWPRDPEAQHRALACGQYPLTGTVFELLSAHEQPEEADNLIIASCVSRPILAETTLESIVFNQGKLRDRLTAGQPEAEIRRIKAEIYDPQATALLNLLKDRTRRLRFVASFPSEADMRREVFKIAQRKLRQKLGIASLRNPFKQNLSYWTIDDEKQLPGRSDAIRDVLVDMKDRGDLVLLKGRSGCGKSSLMQSGIMRRLREVEGSIPVPFRPTELMAGPGEGDALERLVRLITETVQVPVPAGGPMAMRPENYAKQLCVALERNHVDVVLGLDQFEEIIDELKLEKERSTGLPQSGWWLVIRFLKVLCNSQNVRLIATLESARETSFQELGIGEALGLMPKTINVDATDDTVAEIARSGFARGGLPLDPDVVEAIKRKWRAFEQEAQRDNASPLPLACLFFHRLYERFADQAGETAGERTKSAFMHAGSAKDERLLKLQEIGGEGAIAFAGIIQNLADAAWRERQGELNFTESFEKSQSFQALNNFLKPFLAVDHDGQLRLLAPVERDANTVTVALRKAFLQRRLLVRVPGEGPSRIRFVHQALVDRWSPASRWLEIRKKYLQEVQQFIEDVSYWRRRNRTVPVHKDGTTLQAAALTLYERSIDWVFAEGNIENSADFELRDAALSVLGTADDPYVVVEGSPTSITYIQLAARYHCVELLKKFAKGDPKCLSYEDEEGKSLLFEAVWSDGPAVPYLIEQGASLKIEKTGESAIAAAIGEYQNENFDAMVRCIEVDEVIHDASGAQMVSFAASHGNEHVINCLIERSATLDLKDRSGRTCLHHAAMTNQADAFRQLLPHVDIESQDKFKNTAISVAAIGGSADVLSAYLAEDTSLDRVSSLLLHRNSWGETPLMLAAIWRRPEAIRLLLQAELGDLGDPTSEAHLSEDGDTLFHGALRHGFGERPREEERFRARTVVELLLRDGRLDPNQPNNENQTPFDIAGAFPEARRVLRQDDRVPKDYAKMTPAMRIEDLSSRRPSTVLRLVEEAPQALTDEHANASEPNASIFNRPNGKSPSSADGAGSETGIDILVRLKNHVMLSILAEDETHWLALRAELTALLAVATIDAAVGLRKALMRRVASGDIELHEAGGLVGASVDAGDSETAKAIVELGVSPALRIDDEGNTILHRAAISSDVERFRSVLAIAPFTVPLDGWGRRPSDLAAESLAETFAVLEAEMEVPTEAEGSFMVSSSIAGQAPFLGLERDETARAADETETAVLRRDWKEEWGDIDALDLRVFDLPFYPNVPLIELQPRSASSAVGRLYFLIQDNKLFRLNGTSSPIHEVNNLEPPVLTEETSLQYLAFFCFFVRGDEGPFLIVDRAENCFLPDFGERREDIADVLRAPKVWGRNEEGYWLVSSLVYYPDAVFFANFNIQPSGMVEMISDTPILKDLPAGVPAPVEIRVLN